jgi:hypothetical protein
MIREFHTLQDELIHVRARTVIAIGATTGNIPTVIESVTQHMVFHKRKSQFQAHVHLYEQIIFELRIIGSRDDLNPLCVEDVRGDHPCICKLGMRTRRTSIAAMWIGQIIYTDHP